MYFNSSRYLPEDLSAHKKMQWQNFEALFSSALRDSGYTPAQPYYVQGEVDLSDPSIPDELRYSDEGHTWCHDCAKTIQTGAIRAWQDKLKLDIDPEDERIRFLDKDPATFDWWDLVDFFEGYTDDAPMVCESDIGSSHDLSCSGCGETLDHSLERYSFADRLECYDNARLKRVFPEDLFCFLVMMGHSPGDKQLFKLAQSAKKILDRDGLSSHKTEAREQPASSSEHVAS